MSKYNPLRQALQKWRGREAPMSFAQIEGILDFPLPSSARRLQAWWANTGGTHVQAAAWLDAGWRTARVDLGAERVVFVRAEGVSKPGRSGMSAGVGEGDAAIFIVRREALTPGAFRLVEDYAEELGVDLNQAAAFALNAAAADRRRKLVEEFSALSPRLAGDSTDLIREERDAR